MMIRICEELNQYQPVTPDIRKMEKRSDKMHVIRFLSALWPEYELIQSQILGSSEHPSSPNYLTPGLLLNRQLLLSRLDVVVVMVIVVAGVVEAMAEIQEEDTGDVVRVPDSVYQLWCLWKSINYY